MISIRYSIPPPLISRYTSVISEATGFNYIAIRRHIVGFNPCFLEGRDYRCKTAKLISKPFQSTLPRRERRSLMAFISSPVLFQSTLPRRERLKEIGESFLSPDVSIHAPTKGATLYESRSVLRFYRFNPRSHEGSDCCDLCLHLFSCRFNPRSHEGSDGAVFTGVYNRD